jgi:hypothetical protein
VSGEDDDEQERGDPCIALHPVQVLILGEDPLQAREPEHLAKPEQPKDLRRNVRRSGGGLAEGREGTRGNRV